MPVPQASLGTPDTGDAIFLVLAVNAGSENAATVVQVCRGLDRLVRAVAARDPGANLSAIVAFGAEVWERLYGPSRPGELHLFQELRAGNLHAPSTPGDLLLHIRAERMDLCYELAAQIMAALGGSVAPIDEVHGFRYFDDRDLIGFVDGTENPAGVRRALALHPRPARLGGSRRLRSRLGPSRTAGSSNKEQEGVAYFLLLVAPLGASLSGRPRRKAVSRAKRSVMPAT
jgi:Dyp-type peroxidase family